MAYQTKPGNGSLWRNDRKTNDNHPDYSGSITLLDGTECWLSMWQKDEVEGERKPLFSLSIKVKDAAAGQGGAAPSTRKLPTRRPPPGKIAEEIPTGEQPPDDGTDSGVPF